jgi:predicted ATPase/class 3 adenylate cyclase
MECPQCGTENPKAAKFCLNCGTRMALACPQCGADLPLQARFCTGCGAPVGAALAPAAEPAITDIIADRLRRLVPKEYADRLLPARGQLSPERRTVTILFSDVKGSTAMAENLDPEEVLEVMAGAFEFLIAAIYRYEGTLARLMGDAILAFFGAPIAHEDDPERACRAALQITAEAQTYARKLEKEKGIRGFNVRVGINTGLVVVGEVGSDLRVEYTAMGDAINLAARMESAAEPGTVLITEATHKLIAPLFETEDLGPLQVKGKIEPVQVYRVLAAKAVSGKARGITGLESPLVGRQTEFAALLEAVEHLKLGVGSIATIVGDAGIGKSRLAAELRKALVDDPAPLQWVEGRCLSYGTSIAYLLWLDVLRNWLAMTAEDSLEQVRETLHKRIAALGSESFGSIFPYLARLLSLPLDATTESRLRDLDGQELKANTFDAVEALFLRAANQRPLVLVLEDLHWVDPTSAELLERLLGLSDRAPLLFVSVFRPERESPCWRIKEAAARTYPHRHTDLWLDPLSAAESRLLVANLLRVEGLPPRLKDRILAVTEGNPFYTEEVLRSLIDQKAIVRDKADGWWRATENVTDIPIPDTLQGVLLARIDRLQEDTKRVLQMASVIGRIFLYRVLTCIAQEERQLDQHLVTLQRQELIRERARIPDLEYIFKHELTREAAYTGLLKKERRLFHRQVAEALERLFPERSEEWAGLLAYHWERADEPARATEYLLQAGDLARLAYAHEEAAGHYSKAIELASNLKNPEAAQAVATAHKGRAQVRMTQGSFAEARPDLEAWLDQACRAHDRAAEAESRCQLAQVLLETYELDTCRAHIEQALALARSLGSQSLIARSLSTQGYACLTQGRLAEASDHLTECAAVFGQLGDMRSQAETLWPLAGAHAMGGNYREALPILHNGLALCEETHHGFWLNGCYYLLAMTLANLGQYGQALAAAEEALRSAEATGISYWIPRMFNTQGWIHQELQAAQEAGGAQIEVEANSLVNLATDHRLLGDYSRARQCLQAAEDMVQRKDWCSFRCGTRWLWEWGQLALAEGDCAEARHYAERVIQTAATTEQKKYIAKGWQLKGDTLMIVGKLSEAASALQQALDTAEEIGQRNLVWPTRNSLARLLEHQGRPAEAKVQAEQAIRTIEQIAADTGDERLRRSFLQSAAVDAVYDNLKRLGQ